MAKIALLFMFLLPIAATKASHSLELFATYIIGPTPFPRFSYVVMLDDVRIMYYNGDMKTLIPRGNTTTEDDVFDIDDLLTINDDIHSSFLRRLAGINIKEVDSVFDLQQMVVCELKDDNETEQMIMQEAWGGSTTETLLYADKNFTYHGTFNISDEVVKTNLNLIINLHESFYKPFCFKTLKGYLEKRSNQINRKEKPKVSFHQKEISSGFRLSCLATGFYPRHINLTLLTDGQPVSDHEITGGDLLPNDDGTYQMRKSLEITADQHKYTCSATHLSLDNKLDVTWVVGTDAYRFPIGAVVAVVLVCVICGILLIVIWLGRSTGDSSCLL